MNMKFSEELPPCPECKNNMERLIEEEYDYACVNSDCVLYEYKFKDTTEYDWEEE